MSRWLKCTSMHFNTDWNKYDDRLMKAVERGEVDKVAAVLSKKGIIPTKLDVEGRSAFHLAATRGHVDCLNLILGHNVDITASDATGKNALHLASRHGHSLCVQKLLQHNCPVGNVDLQGRTALHDAVMAGCPSSVKLLCDSGASVNAVDFDGRTPLVLATQMCHPRICQLLLERGADFTVRDKQNKTPLILGCEFGCKDAVEVLLKSGADVRAADGLGHDAFHYAQLSKNPELVAIVKSYLDKATRDKEAAKIEQWKRQHSVERTEAAEASRRDQIIHDLERQNDALQEGLRKCHQEQKALLDKVNMLQQQLTQEKLAVENTHKEKEQLKLLLSAKEREEGARGPETVKVQLRSTLGEYSGQSVIKGKESILVKQAHSLDSDHMLQNPAMSRSLSRPLEKSQPTVGWDLSGELEALRHELEAVKRRHQAAEEETSRLQTALNRKNRECQELVQSRDTIQKQADQQVQELEDALGDVQKRMLDSECKVKQLQAHVVAVKEHLGGQATEELRAQLLDVKAKYEGASAEVGRVRNRLKQSEKALEEYKSSESQLAAETERLNQELGVLTAERDELAETLVEMETQLKEAQTKHGNTVPAEKFDNMKNLLTNAVDEKERQLAELREDYDRVLEEVAELHRKLDSPSSQGGSAADEEQQRIRAALEEQNSSLKRRLVDVTAKSQALIHEVEEYEEERDLLREQLDEINSRIEMDFIPLKDHEEVRTNMVTALEELEDKLVEASERYGKAEAQVEQLQAERATLQENVSSLHSASEKHQSEMEVLRSQNAELMKKLELLQKTCEDRDKECEQLTAQSQTLRQNLEGQFVPRQQHEQVKMELSSALERVKAEMLKTEAKEKESVEELKNVKEGNEKLKEKFEKVQLEIKKDFISIKDHRAVTEKLNAAVVEAENRANEASAMYASAQEETVKLTQELEAQKKELDTIQEAIQSKFVPLTAAEEKETSYSTQLKELTVQLLEMEEKYNQEKTARESSKQEKEKLIVEIESVQQRLDSALVSSEKHKEVEEEFSSKYEELNHKFVSLEQEHQQLTLQKAELQDQNALCNTQIQNLQERLKSELTRIATYDSELKALHDAMQQAQSDCKKAREAQQEETQKVCVLQKELQEHRGDHAALLQQHAKAKEALEAEVAKLQADLREEEESNTQRAEDISALQSELLQATEALEEIRYKEDQMNQLKKEKQQLEEEAANLSNKLLSLAEECEEAHQEATQAREGENSARTEMEAVQEKGRAIEREIRDLKERYDESLSTICDLQRRIQTSAQQTEAKDKKITELLTDVERLKQALNGLSQLAYTSNAPNKRQTQHIDTLQAQIKSLQQQLADAERQHREVVSIYRTHLLSAAQGHMDEDVQAALLQIIRMRQEFVC
ncbi:uveal autoantigen with coiled-coil domains and ankyrin repeats protein isoform X2 [Acanthochromis polyacanthus]|uniref:uveal autoantigen with coiled-coil domains and ankyrin repeats protein isoform X2 n=1 Tax=Acanthochromis polyacanthus TaxID=80966 RepID=UPI00223451C7|nr:uveal autoantigen with coiled-coil domains and ankyrin repeats protein isoform X2 [Acanthochromis polyacanthus]